MYSNLRHSAKLGHTMQMDVQCNLRFSRQWLWRTVSSGMLRRVALVITEVSEDLSASFIRVTRMGELGTTLAATSNRRTLWRNTKWFLATIKLYLTVSHSCSRFRYWNIHQDAIMWYHENVLCSYWLVFSGITFIHMMIVVFLDVSLCGSRKNRRIWGTYCLHHQSEKKQWPRNVSSN
jgi:hypothetical protein